MTNNRSRDAGLVFPRIRRDRTLADQVADLLIKTILDEKLQPGDALPSERELGDQFGVSRTVIREAVRSLTARGLIDAGTGRRLRVATVNASTVTESMGLYLRAGSIDFDRIHEVRKLLEVQIAGLSAERASDAEIENMKTTFEKMANEKKDMDLAAEYDLEFHRSIAVGTGNEFYLLLLDSIGEGLLEIRRERLRAGGYKTALREHRVLLERIRARDPEGARQAMADHLDTVARGWKESGQVSISNDGLHA